MVSDAAAAPAPEVLSALQGSNANAAAQTLVGAAGSGGATTQATAAAWTAAASSNPTATAQATAAAAAKNTGATATVLAAAQAQAVATGKTSEVAKASVQALSAASSSGNGQAMSAAFARVSSVWAQCGVAERANCHTTGAPACCLTGRVRPAHVHRALGEGARTTCYDASSIQCTGSPRGCLCVWHCMYVCAHSTHDIHVQVILQWWCFCTWPCPPAVAGVCAHITDPHWRASSPSWKATQNMSLGRFAKTGRRVPQAATCASNDWRARQEKPSPSSLQPPDHVSLALPPPLCACDTLKLSHNAGHHQYCCQQR